MLISSRRLTLMLDWDLTQLIQTVGYLGMFGIIFVETGLLAGFFLPGDTLLLTAGILASAGKLNLPLTMIVCAVGSICGDQLGYYIGHKLGPRVFNRPESRFFHPENVVKARAFFDKYGLVTILIARFVPVIRAFAPTMAGTSGVPYPKFLMLSVLGGVLWGVSITALGYFLGNVIGPKTLEKYILLVLVIGIGAGVVPSLIHLLRGNKKATSSVD
jgi:membrane-associated protein